MDRGAVVIVEDERLMLIERVRGGRTYYLFPGGGIEEGETAEDAAVREAREELGLDVKLGRMIALVTHAGSRQYHFLATVTGGTFGTGHGEELGSSPDSPEGSYRPVALALDALSAYDIRPKELADALRANRTAEGDPVLYFED